MGIQVFPAASGGVTQKVQEFTSTGTFTVPSNCTAVEIFLVGGGGGGGGYGTNTTANNGGGAGGGGGGMVIKRFLPVTAGSSYTVTIGAGGAGGAYNTAPAKGGDSSFGALATAYGGGAGVSFDNNTNNFYRSTSTIIGSSGGKPSYAGSTQNSAHGGPGGGAGGNAFGTKAGYSVDDNYQYGDTPYPGAALYGGGRGMYGSLYSADASQKTAGMPIDGYGGGGGGGYIYSNGTTDTNHTAISLGYTAGGATADNGNTATAGSSGTANTGHGGGGASGRWGSGGAKTASGGSGASGFCRVTYWS